MSSPWRWKSSTSLPQGQLCLAGARAAERQGRGRRPVRGGAGQGEARRAGLEAHPHPEYPSPLGPYRRQPRTEAGDRVRRSSDRRRIATASRASTWRSAKARPIVSARKPRRGLRHPGPHPWPYRLWFSDSDALFCGDTLFRWAAAACSKARLRRCGLRCRKLRACRRRPASIAATNIRSRTPASPWRSTGNRALKSRAARVDSPARPRPADRARDARRGARDQPVPARRRHSLRARPGLDAKDPVAVFAAIRARKDKF